MLSILMLFFLTTFHVQYCQAEQDCTSSIPASTPDARLIENDDGTVRDTLTGLHWKQCLEGLSGYQCEVGNALMFDWQNALERPGIVNSNGGFAGYTDWRLPNIKELFSIVERRCSIPSLNLNRFPNPSNSDSSRSAPRRSWFRWRPIPSHEPPTTS